MADVVRYDFDVVSADGSDTLTQAIMKHLNEYPRLGTGKTIEFQLLDEQKGIAMFPNPSVAVLSEREDITGHVTQKCVYAFSVVYRLKAGVKVDSVKEWLDSLGRWIESVDTPVLAHGYEFDKFIRTSQAYKYGETKDKSEDWLISIQASYKREYDK